MYTWKQFYAMPYEIYDGAKAFWEPGYDYNDPDFWESYDPKPDPRFVKAVQMYDYLKRNDPDGE